jgi:hypothetical protein
MDDVKKRVAQTAWASVAKMVAGLGHAIFSPECLTRFVHTFNSYFLITAI